VDMKYRINLQILQVQLIIQTSKNAIFGKSFNEIVIRYF